MNKKTLKDVQVENKTVLVRVDFNVPIKGGKITDENRITEALPTIKYLMDQKAKVVLFSHLGRVESEEDKSKNSLQIVADNLKIKLGDAFTFINQTRGEKVEAAVKNLKQGHVLLLENTRFEDVPNKLESKNKPELGQYWAKLGDIFVNDAFGTAHRAHASNVGIASNIAESCVGFLIQKELEMLGKGLNQGEKPFIAILGGAKVSDKIAVIENLIDKTDAIIIGGGMAYTFLSAKGINVGKSLVESEKIDFAKKMLEQHESKILLPIDHATALKFEDTLPNITEGQEIPSGQMALDIGPKTIEKFAEVIKSAKTVIWNGPMGVFEFKNFAKGTIKVCEAIAHNQACFSLIGGGDSAAAANQLGFAKAFTHISTGGGASLEFMEGKELPGISAIQDK